ncbi:class I adenylate-forming enzyme family protein [Paraburkholderia sediminicola]|uniref:class I adenylate-forming enzyme family protein n=1 Tax=Paraburkholderia sediminicola TaxID=458836 RepID=UPI0038BD56AD
MPSFTNGKIVVPEIQGLPFIAVPDMIRQWAERMPDHHAVISGELEVTWSAFDSRINMVANALIESGMQRGDKLAILAANSVEYLEIVMGAVRAGVCVVPLSAMGQAQTCRDLIEDSDSKMLFVSSHFASLVIPLLPELRKLNADGCIAINFAADGWRSYEDWTTGASDEPCGVRLQPDDDFNIIYSSGTTGKPKGIVHSHYLRSAMRRIGELLGYDTSSVSLVSTPLFSNATLAGMLITMLQGGTVVLMDKFDVELFLELAQARKVTHALLVPVQFERILGHPRFGQYDLTHFRAKVSTSAPLRESVKRDCLARWPGRLFEVYTLTEGGIVTVFDAAAHPDKLHTVGRAAPGCVLKIVDESGHELPAGSVGEIVGRAALMMNGYYRNIDKTRELLWYDSEGALYFKSGDMGKLDDEGFLQLLDRQKDVIISGGFNVFPVDIENVILTHPAVADVAVIGVPNERWGESPLALVVTRTPIVASELLVWANARLGKTERLADVEIRDSLPRSAIGKVMKRELRQAYWTNYS